MTDNLKLYQYGFAFSDKQVNVIPQQFNKIPVLSKYYYYYDNQAEVNIVEKDKEFIIIHGHFAYSNMNKSLTKNELMNKLLIDYYTDYDEYLETLNFIAGRYIVIIGNLNEVNIFPDAINTRSTYFSMDKNLIASHVEIIADNGVYNLEKTYEGIPRLNNILLHTPYKLIKSLVPNHYLDFYSKNIKRFFPRKSNKYINLSEEEKLRLIEGHWKRQMEEYFSTNQEFLLSISGGNDSRVTLAMVKGYIDRISFFTFGTYTEKVDVKDRSARIYEKDKIIVRQIVNDLKLNHNFYYFDKEDKAISPNDEEMLKKTTLHPLTKKTLPYLKEFFPNNKAMHIRTNLLELGRAPFLRPYKLNVLKSSKDKFKNDFKNYYEQLGEYKFEELYDEFVKEINFGSNLFDYHILDIHYWEIYIGRWYGEVLNSQDSIYNTLSPFNHRAIIDIALSFSYKQRVDNLISRELINRNFPVLNFYGINELENLYEKSRINIFSNDLEFDEFTVANTANNEIYNKKCINNILYLEEGELTKGSKAYVNIVFDKKYGNLEFDLLNTYQSEKHKGYMKYVVYCNNKKILSEDISKWSSTNKIVITNLTLDDIITIKVIALRNINTKAWARASKIKIEKINTTLSKETFKKKVYCSSPYSVVEQ